MSTKNHRQGGKFGGSHTTVIDAAVPVVDLAHKLPSVTNISPGFITSGLRPANGKIRVKLTEFLGGVLLNVRGNTSQQEIRIYSTDVKGAMLGIARGVRNLGHKISFKND
jgi:hypothetical protein